MQQRLSDVTLGDIGRGLARYRPFVAMVAAVWLVVTLAPGKESAAPVAQGTTGTTEAVTDTTLPAASTDTTVAGAPAGTPGTRATGGRGRATTRVDGNVPPSASALAAPDCNPATGRVKIPSIYAPPCVAPFTGTPTATYRGMRDGGKTIEVVVYLSHFTPGTQAALEAAGAADSRDESIQMVKDYVEYFEHHYETYGRKVHLDFYDATTNTDQYDDTAARADAKSIYDQYDPFAVWGGPLQEASFGEELAARGVLCFCTVGRPNDFYFKNAPFVWTVGPTGNEAFTIWGEYAGKRLWGRKAKWAGTDAYKLVNRKFGIIYVDTEDHGVSPSVDVFRKEFARYGGQVSNDDVKSYNFDIARAQEQATTMVASLKANNVTTVVPITDPLYPIFLTRAAAQQDYHPEYYCVGGLLTDTAVFARDYDQNQWEHCFGVSPLVARILKELGDPYRLYQWHFGANRTPPAVNGFAVIYGPIWQFYLGVHLAGATLNPQTFRDGLYRYPPSGGGRTSLLISWGFHGFWPYEDLGTFEDEVEIWWDRNARGPDETQSPSDCDNPQNNCTGLYRYVDGGKRYRVGQWPTTDPRAFDPAGTSLIYDKPPPEDQWPEYPHKEAH